MGGGDEPTEANQDVAIEIDIEWLESVKDRASKSLDGKPPPKPTIFRVPPSMRSGNLYEFEPKLVSIGPYHHCKSDDLKAMEKLKWRLLHRYLSIVPDESNNKGFPKMKELEIKARACYSEVIDFNSYQFMEILLLDGCFLVQTFITFDDHQALKAEELRSLLCDNMWFQNLILRDLMMLENQLPYFIVEYLLDALRLPGWNSSRLQRVAINWFTNILPQYSDIPKPELSEQGFQVDHLLHLFHKWITNIPKLVKPSSTKSSCKLPSKLFCSILSSMINNTRDSLSKALPCCSKSPLLEESPMIAPTMVELVEAGVKIKVREANSFLDISFCKEKGELKIPAITVDDFTNFILANLIAFEQSCSRHGLDITHYTFFLDEIINTPRDVELLHQEGIIHRNLGNDENITSLFNKQCIGVTGDNKSNYLEDVYRDLNAYCRSRWPRWRAKAMRDYFNNPWAIISLGAAVLLLTLTILQSVYSVMGYYKMHG